MRPAKYQNQIEFIHPKISPFRIETAWYKWEFLRRNSEYRADCQKFVTKHGRWFEERGYWYDYRRRLAAWSKADEDHFYENIAAKLFAQDSPDQGLRKVQDHLKAAKKLIAGHYKEIR